MKPFRKTITALVGFDRRERRGTFILALLITVLLIFRFTALRSGRPPTELPPLNSDNKELIATGSTPAVPAVPHFFDPNTAGFDELVGIGLTERQARTLINYRNSGAWFRRPGDLLRVYGIDSATAAGLIPYVRIAESDVGAKDSPHGDRKAGVEWSIPTEPSGRGGSKAVLPSAPAGGTGSKTTFSPDHAGGGRDTRIDLNTCSTEELESLPGIGPVLALRVIRYRSLLGGFVEPGQLAEVYGLDSAVVKMIEAKLILSYDSLRPLVLDSVTFGDLARHPYLGFDAARVITRYRTVTGQPVTLGEMVGKGVISRAQALRIAPYVKPPEGITGSDYEFISSKVLK